MSTVRVKGQHVRVSDDLWYLGKPYRVTRIEPYRHLDITRGEDWRIAYSDGPDGMYTAAWAITLTYEGGYAASYEISLRPGEPAYVNEPPEDDLLSPFYGEGARLYPKYRAEGWPTPWCEWLESVES